MLDTCTGKDHRVLDGARGAGFWHFEDNAHGGCQSGLAWRRVGRGLDEGNSVRQDNIDTCGE